MKHEISQVMILLDSDFHHYQKLSDRLKKISRLFLADDCTSVLNELSSISQEENIQIEHLQVDLGDINVGDFERVFRERFRAQFRKQLQEYGRADPHKDTDWSAEVESRSEHTTEPQKIVGALEGNTVNSPGYNELMSNIVRDLCQDTGGQFNSLQDTRTHLAKGLQAKPWTKDPARWQRLLMPLLLRPTIRQRLLAWTAAAPLLRWLCQGYSPSSQALLLKALCWLQTNALSSSLRAVDITDVLPVAEVPEILPERHPELLATLFSAPARTPALRAWQRALWRQEAVRRALESKLPKAMREHLAQRPMPELEGLQQEGLPVSSAGLVLLWPLLPDLFTRLKLWHRDAFVSPQAQQEAAMWLDWLVWQSPPPMQRLYFSCWLCGLPGELPEEQVCFEPDAEQQSIVTAMLSSLQKQLPGLRTLTDADIRGLFLQRSGSLRIDESASATLTIEPQLYDVFLRDWPWPLNLLTLPWLSQPLAIDWALPDFDTVTGHA